MQAVMQPRSVKVVSNVAERNGVQPAARPAAEKRVLRRFLDILMLALSASAA